MVDKITTKPVTDESIVDKDGNPTDQTIEWFDDLEIIINETVGGDAITFPSYAAGALPLPSLNPNSMAFGNDGTLDYRLPVFSAILETLTPVTINNVTDASGVAQFNFTPGPTLAVGEEVNISDFASHPTYLGNFKVSVVGIGFFRIASIAFAGSETSIGKFTPVAAWRKTNDLSIIS